MDIIRYRDFYFVDLLIVSTNAIFDFYSAVLLSSFFRVSLLSIVSFPLPIESFHSLPASMSLLICLTEAVYKAGLGGVIRREKLAVMMLQIESLETSILTTKEPDLSFKSIPSFLRNKYHDTSFLSRKINVCENFYTRYSRSFKTFPL